MKKFIITILCIAAAAIAAYGIKYALTPVNTQNLEYTTHETRISTRGYIILDEWLMTSRSTGTFYHSVSEGERVSRDSSLGEFFYGEVEEGSLRELAIVDSRIKAAHADRRSNTIVDLDTNTVESNIFRRENDIIDANEDNDILSISKYKRDINSLRAKNELSAEDTADELYQRRTEILDGIGLHKDEIYSQIAGVFTMYTDGCENMLRFADLESYNLAYFDSLSSLNSKMSKIDTHIEPNGPMCKVVNNHMFYVMVAADASEMSGRKYGDSVKIRFKNMSNAMKNGIIYSIGEEQDGRVLVIVQCTEYLEDALSYRTADTDIIFESYTGYKVPVQAIHTDPNGRQKVIGIKGNVEYDCYFDELYTYSDGGYAIIKSSSEPVNNLSDMESIRVGER